jgi:hypothetical protein
MPRTLLRAATPACAAFLVMPALGRAADVAAVGDKAVIVPYGDWIVAGGQVAAAVLVPLLVAAILWAVRTTVPVLGAFVSQALVERLVENVTAYAQNAVAGAVKGKVLDIPTGSAVIAQAAQRAVDQAPGWLLKEAGGPAGIAEKVFRTLHLADDATAGTVLAPALQAVRAARTV